MNQIQDGGVTSPRGFLGGAAACGIKKEGKLDISLVFSEQDCTAAGVFTQSQVVAAPVILDQETLDVNSALLRGVVTTSGNANACTGDVGLHNARQQQKLAAKAVGCSAPQMLVLSTGVIGVQLPMDNVEEGISAAAEDLSHGNNLRAVEGICTTDTFVKQMAIEVELSGGTVTIGGMAKGAGMIHPNVATMLGVITTDAQIDVDVLRAMLNAAVDVSFNCISVDGDTSTNDTVLLFANGASGVEIDRKDWTIGSDYAIFSDGLIHVCKELSKLIVRDGEGATKFIELTVSGAINKSDAHQIANTVATSPLVKTAFAGSDANWGRIMAAAGRAGIKFDQHKTTLKVSTDQEKWLVLLDGGLPTGYEEADAAAIFAERDIFVQLELQEGLAEATVWTCDLSHGYVSINADYRS